MTSTDQTGEEDDVVREQFRFTVTEPIWLGQGDRIVFESVLIPPLLDCDRFPTQGHFDGMLLALYVGHKHRGAFLGSAVIVAPGVAIGAKHVVEEYIEKLAAGAILISGIGLGENGRCDLWDVKHIMLDGSHDVAILSLVRRTAIPDNRKLRQATLSTRLPGVGEPVMIAGFKPDELLFENEERSAFSFSGNIWGSVGIVADHYLSRRDTVMLPWPSFRVDVGSWGAMSGGPVFDKTGTVVGVLCSAMGTDGDGYSCVSMLHPALGMPFLPSWPNDLYQETETLLESRVCKIEGREAVSMGSDSEGRITWTYRDWT